MPLNFVAPLRRRVRNAFGFEYLRALHAFALKRYVAQARLRVRPAYNPLQSYYPTLTKV
jgi:hypothetical protein